MFGALREAAAQRRIAAAGIEKQFAGMEDATMPREKQTSKRKRVTKAAMPALGAAGLTFGLVGGASASTTPTSDAPQKLNLGPTQAVTLDEEEIADVSLATFHLFDKENNGSAIQQMAWGCRCGGCRACRCGGCGCRCAGCAGCGGCGVWWCWPRGCRIC